jgi:hypothetical protein
MIFKTITSISDTLKRERKSRRDVTLLTVDFNLRKMNVIRIQQNPAGMTLLRSFIVSSDAGLYATYVTLPVRTLKCTVNKVLSLRDSSPRTILLTNNNFFIPKYQYSCYQFVIYKPRYKAIRY